MERSTFSMYQLPQLQRQIYSVFKRTWIGNFSNVKLVRLVYVQSVKNYILNALVLLTLIVDELIRQITIQCLERGYLLVRVREELRMTVEAYQSLYESSIAYGMRKTILAEKRRNDMDAQILQLERECGELQSSVDNLEKIIIDFENEFKETPESLENQHNLVVK